MTFSLCIELAAVNREYSSSSTKSPTEQNVHVSECQEALIILVYKSRHYIGISIWYLGPKSCKDILPMGVQRENGK